MPNSTGARADRLGGVQIRRGENNTIGGTTEASRNIISGNLGFGVRISVSQVNYVQGNYIGTDVSGANDHDRFGEPLGNTQGGVLIEDSAEDVVGGDVPLVGASLRSAWRRAT